MIAGDLSLPMLKLRAVSEFINIEASRLDLQSGSAYLAEVEYSESIFAAYLSEFDISRMERICETTNVFSHPISELLSKVATWRTVLKASVEILATIKVDEGRDSTAVEVVRQANMLQEALIEVHNEFIRRRGLMRVQAACLITE